VAADPEPVVVAIFVAAPLPELAVAEGLKDDEAKKKELMHEDWQLAYEAVSGSVPLPWGHLAAHSVVALTCDGLGHGTLTQAA